ncbi:hypothetical protein AWB81_06703 [Caballeronia arationis]|nr:hypothetical protein AWB81_06703 [Caballeronia arationis]
MTEALDGAREQCRASRPTERLKIALTDVWLEDQPLRLDILTAVLEAAS